MVSGLSLGLIRDLVVHSESFESELGERFVWTKLTRTKIAHRRRKLLTTLSCARWRSRRGADLKRTPVHDVARRSVSRRKIFRSSS
jgi:hypothetical protein